MTLALRKSNDIAHHLQLPEILNRGYRGMRLAQRATQNKHMLVAIPSTVVENFRSRQGSDQETPANLRDHSAFLSTARCFDHLANDRLATVAVQDHQQRRSHHDHHHRRADHDCLPHPRLHQRPAPGNTAPQMAASGGRALRFARASKFRLTNHPVLPPAHLNHERVIRCANYLRLRAERLPKDTEHSCGLMNNCSVMFFPTLHQGFGRTTQPQTSRHKPAAAFALSNITWPASAIGPATRSPRSSVRSSSVTRCGMFASRRAHSHLLAKESALRFNSSLPAK
jgi:hypothetical protein